MIYEKPPVVGLVIGTFASVPYIHLQLEARARHAPDMPCLVIDDGSPDEERLRRLCSRYGAGFAVNASRRGHVPGDMMVFINGLSWAQERGVELLAKFSRRWIPLIEWREELQRLATDSQAATFSGRCVANGFGFRTEALAMHVETWLQTNALDPVRSAMTRSEAGHFVLVEAIVHKSAAIAHKAQCEQAKEYAKAHPDKPGCGAYADWPLLGDSRKQVLPGVLWHNSNKAALYHRALLQWGIHEYGPADFIDKAANLQG